MDADLRVYMDNNYHKFEELMVMVEKTLIAMSEYVENAHSEIESLEIKIDDLHSEIEEIRNE